MGTLDARRKTGDRLRRSMQYKVSMMYDANKNKQDKWNEYLSPIAFDCCIKKINKADPDVHLQGIKDKEKYEPPFFNLAQSLEFVQRPGSTIFTDILISASERV